MFRLQLGDHEEAVLEFVFFFFPLHKEEIRAGIDAREISSWMSVRVYSAKPNNSSDNGNYCTAIRKINSSDDGNYCAAIRKTNSSSRTHNKLR